jgi:hypothetical protein
MADMFADNLVKNAIKRIIDGEIYSNFEIWKQMTKNFIRNEGFFPIFESIQIINNELSDEQWFENKYPKEIFKEKKEVRIFKENNKLRELINIRLRISDVAKKYGLDTDKKGITTCPFHYDTSPSLHLDSKKNIFHCFGCGAKGNIITFIKKLEEAKEDGNKERCRTEGN